MNAKELYHIREWSPLTNVTERIPTQIRLGLFSIDVNLTCIDAVDQFLALGSDVGIVFWYDRYTGKVQKLKAEVNSAVTCVRIVDSVEFMIAAGNTNGQVSVFQIQKALPPDLDLVAPCTRPKPIQRYTIRELHRNRISCCEWSKNGMKLYSGDRNGVVVLTEFDYQTHLSKSIEILKETYEIVQLSVHQNYLLISTLYRSIILQRSNATGEWKLTQIGKKDRKQLVDCGGIFFKQKHIKQPRLICGRPGLRFWIADTDGNVEKTLLFRDAIARSPTWEIPILNPKTITNQQSRNLHEYQQQLVKSLQSEEISTVAHRNFCNIYSYADQESLLVTHDESTLYILNLERLCVEAMARRFRKIIDFSVCGKEIFVLEGSRSLCRLAPTPEKPNQIAKVIFNPLMPPPIPMLGASMYNSFESPIEYEPEQEIIKAEECFELQPIESTDIPIELAIESPRAAQNRRFEILNQISELDFDQTILHHSGISTSTRKKRKNHDVATVLKKSEGIVEIGQAAGITPNNEIGKQTPTLNVENKIQKIKPNTLALTTKSTPMETSYCCENDSIAKTNESVKTSDLQKYTNQPETLAEELGLTHGDNFGRINPFMKTPNTPATILYQSNFSQLSQAYPSDCNVAGVQTTPLKNIYYLQDQQIGDYSNGEPVDDISQALRVTTIIEEQTNLKSSKTDVDDANNSGRSISTATQTPTLQFVSTQPLEDEIDSFLLDFRRAADPVRKTPPSGDSNASTSSEWEFLDN